jgi:hypothetical protein
MEERESAFPENPKASRSPLTNQHTRSNRKMKLDINNFSPLEKIVSLVGLVIALNVVSIAGNIMNPKPVVIPKTEVASSTPTPAKSFDQSTYERLNLSAGACERVMMVAALALKNTSSQSNAVELMTETEYGKSNVYIAYNACASKAKGAW